MSFSNNTLTEWGQVRAKASRNLFFFETALCSEAWPDRYHDFGHIQKLMCDFLQDNAYRRKFLSAFRLSFKTTVLAGFICWLFCLYLSRDKPTAIIYNTATKDNAYNFASDVKQTLLENDYLKWVYPELPKTEGGYKKMTQQRIQHGHVRIDFASSEQSLVTRHYPIWLNDDLENDKNTEFQTGRDGLIRNWRYQKAILTKISKKKLGLEVDVGTPYHHEGLIWMIRNNPKYKRLIIPYRGKDGNLTFPELYTEEDFAEKLEDMGTYLFSCQFDLSPIAEDDAMVKEKWIRYWKDGDLLDYKWRSMVIDPGGAEAKVNDPTGITIVDTGLDGNMDVVLAEEYWLTPTGLMEMIVKLKKDYNPDDIRIEKEKYAVTVADIFQHKYPLMNISFVLHGNRPKPERIWRLRSWFEKGRIRLHKNQKKLIEQLLRYQGEGSIKHDDLIDSLSYHIDIRRLPSAPKPHFLPSGRKFEPEVELSFEKEFDQYMTSEKEYDGREGRRYDAIY